METVVQWLMAAGFGVGIVNLFVLLGLEKHRRPGRPIRFGTMKWMSIRWTGQATGPPRAGCMSSTSSAAQPSSC